MANTNNYFNITKRKKCFRCGEEFAGDETVKNELCSQCENSDDEPEEDKNEQSIIEKINLCFEKAILDVENLRRLVKAAFDKAIETDPKDALAYRDRGIAKYYIDDYKGAIADINKSLELDPKDALAYSSRGYAKSKLGDNEGAIADWDKAIELDK